MKHFALLPLVSKDLDLSKRASSLYLVLREDKSKALMDARELLAICLA